MTHTIPDRIAGRPTRRAAASVGARIATVALVGATLLAACAADVDGASTDPGESTVVDDSSLATTTSIPDGLVWPPGTVTCADLEGNVPVGVDDTGNPLPGLLEFRWGDGLAESVQFADDATCTEESDAWRFLIRPNLDVLFSGSDPTNCELFQALRSADEPPANLDTVLAVADDLCGS